MNKTSPLKPEHAQILKELEKLISKAIPQVDAIEWNKVGVKLEGNKIVGLGLYGCGLTTLPESFR